VRLIRLRRRPFNCRSLIGLFLALASVDCHARSNVEPPADAVSALDAGPDGQEGGAADGGVDDAGRSDPFSGPTRKPLARVREGKVTVTGALRHELVTRIVRQNFGRFRTCYEMLANPLVAGEVVMDSVIASDGTVASANGTSATLPPSVVACIVRNFENQTFPKPRAGSVNVRYVIELSPPRPDDRPPPLLEP
jgi:hypothetical protein